MSNEELAKYYAKKLYYSGSIYEDADKIVKDIEDRSLTKTDIDEILEEMKLLLMTNLSGTRMFEQDNSAFLELIEFISSKLGNQNK